MFDNKHRRLAVQLAGQLPEKRDDAMKVIEALRQLAESFVYDDGTKSQLSPAPVHSIEPKSPSGGL